MKVGLLITARLKSQRLPRKVLLPVRGRPMLAHMVDRLKLAKHVDTIVLCTSVVPEDDPLEEFAGAEGIACYRGDPDDVLARLTAAADAHQCGTVVSCTADNPFVDPVYIDRLVTHHTSEGNDFTSIDGLPWGAFSYALSTEAMHRALAIKDTADTEVWGGYFTQTGLFDCGVLRVEDQAVLRPELRLTVDTPEDFALVEEIFERLFVPGHVFPLEAIVRLLDEHPELRSLNAAVEQQAARPIRVKDAVVNG